MVRAELSAYPEPVDKSSRGSPLIPLVTPSSGGVGFSPFVIGPLAGRSGGPGFTDHAVGHAKLIRR